VTDVGTLGWIEGARLCNSRALRVLNSVYTGYFIALIGFNSEYIHLNCIYSKTIRRHYQKQVRHEISFNVFTFRLIKFNCDAYCITIMALIITDSNIARRNNRRSFDKSRGIPVPEARITPKERIHTTNLSYDTYLSYIRCKTVDVYEGCHSWVWFTGRIFIV